MADIAYRLMRPEDAAEVSALVQSGFDTHIAPRDDIIVEMIEMRQNNHVALLFVADAFQRQGCSRGLLGYAVDRIQRQGGPLERITVNSSRFGVPAYEALGFR
jgi:GNAT superfamily N-acetyltransferase